MLSPQESLEAVGVKTSAVMAYGGGGTALASGAIGPTSAPVIAGLALSEWGVIVGIIVAVVGLAANIWFKIREDRRRSLYWNRKIVDDVGDE